MSFEKFIKTQIGINKQVFKFASLEEAVTFLRSLSKSATLHFDDPRTKEILKNAGVVLSIGCAFAADGAMIGAMVGGPKGAVAGAITGACIGVGVGVWLISKDYKIKLDVDPNKKGYTSVELVPV